MNRLSDQTRGTLTLRAGGWMIATNATTWIASDAGRTMWPLADEAPIDLLTSSGSWMSGTFCTVGVAPMLATGSYNASKRKTMIPLAEGDILRCSWAILWPTRAEARGGPDAVISVTVDVRTLESLGAVLYAPDGIQCDPGEILGELAVRLAERLHDDDRDLSRVWELFARDPARWEPDTLSFHRLRVKP